MEVPKNDGTGVDPVPFRAALNIVEFRPEDYGAVGDGTTDDTAAIQAAIDAAVAAKGTVVLSSKTYRITSTLLMTDTAGLIGNGFYQLYGDRQGYGGIHGSDVMPTVAPFLAGSVLLVTVSNTDAIRFSGVGRSVNLADFGVRFADPIKFKTTGHGIRFESGLNGAGVPFHRYGCFGGRITNVGVYGNDGDHHAFVFVNCAYLTLTKIQSWGGPTQKWIVDDPIGWFGNSVVIAPYSCWIAGGTTSAASYDFVESYAGHGNILITFLRPQLFTFAGLVYLDDDLTLKDFSPPVNTQYTFRAAAGTEKLNVVGANFEGDLSMRMSDPKDYLDWSWDDAHVMSSDRINSVFYPTKTVYAESFATQLSKVASVNVVRSNSSDTVPDPELRFYMGVRTVLSTFEFEAELSFFCVASSVANGLKIAIHPPAVTDIKWFGEIAITEGDGTSPPGSGGTVRASRKYLEGSGGPILGPTSTGTHLAVVKIRGIMTTSNSADNFSVGWGQQVADAAAYTLIAGSSFKANRIY